jgi:hypothetical protein
LTAFLWVLEKIAACGSSYREMHSYVGAAEGCDLLICAITEHKTPRAFLFN